MASVWVGKKNVFFLNAEKDTEGKFLLIFLCIFVCRSTAGQFLRQGTPKMRLSDA